MFALPFGFQKFSAANEEVSASSAGAPELVTFVKEHSAELQLIANQVRSLGMDAVFAAKSGHVGLPLGGAEIGTLVYFALLNQQPNNPTWSDRDRFVLSAGHGSMLQYALLHLAGYQVSLEDLKRFRQLGSPTPGHPEFGHTCGVEVTTGPLGQGIANAVGFALAEQMLAARANCEKHRVVDHHTYVLLGDGCMMEGVAAEACSLAGHLKLSKLIAFYDCNNITIDGTIDITFSENVGKRFEAYGWQVLEAQSHDFVSLATAVEQAWKQENLDHKGIGTGKPTLIICKGVAGKGSPKWEGKPKIHGNPMTAEDIAEAKSHLGISNHTPFFIDPKVEQNCQKLVALRTHKYATWTNSIHSLLRKLADSDTTRTYWLNKLLLNASEQPIDTVDWGIMQGKMATRVASGKALQTLATMLPDLVGGSADLAGSNNTTLAGSSFISAGRFEGRNIHFGVREHAMGAISNGLALHGGLRPYCATFTVFSDYMRPAVRLAALMNTANVFIFTHDSYAVGEDGPTHQPVEHAASLRCIPGLKVIRPADGRETLAAWLLALDSCQEPTALLLTRQDLPDLRTLGSQLTNEQVLEGVRQGAMLLKDFSVDINTTHRIVLVAAGSEVPLALQAAALLEGLKCENLNKESCVVKVRVISTPAPQILAKNSVLLNQLVPLTIPAMAIEAGCGQGWSEIVGRSGAIICMNDFGKSAPATELDKHFGFTPENITQRALNFLGLRAVSR